MTNWRILLTAAGLIFGLAIIAIARAPISAAVAALAYPLIALAAAGVIVAGVITLLIYSWSGFETVATKRAARSVIEAEAETKRAEAELRRAKALAAVNTVATAAPGHQVYTINLAQDVAKGLHLSPQVYTNGYLSAETREGEISRWQMYQALHAPGRKAIEAAPAVPGLAAGLPNVVEVMSQIDRQILTGGTGTGKTNALKHLVAYLVSQGRAVAVVDPHSPSKLVGLDVIGANLDFDEIANFFIETMATVSARYQTGRISQSGNLGELNTYLIIEEFYDIHSQLGELAADFLKTMLVRGRKAGFKFILVTQNDSVQSLGIKGDGGLLFGAERVELKHDLTTGERKAVVGRRVSDQVVCSVPGLFPDYPHVPAGQMVIERPASYSDTERSLIRAMVDNPGASKADIYRAAGVSKNGPNSRFIDEFNAKMGVQG